MELYRNNPAIIKESEKKRFKDPSKVDLVVNLDHAWLESKKQEENLRQQRNQLSRSIGQAKKENDESKVKKLMKQVGNIKNKIATTEVETRRLLKERDEHRYHIGNILHTSVPIAETDEGNVTVSTSGEITPFSFSPKHHADLVIDLGIADLEKAAKISGARMFYLTGEGVLLNLALIQFALNKLIIAGYSPIWTPYLLRGEVMKEAAELADFQEQLYKVENEELYLIATSEQTLAAFHRGDLLEKESLPLKYVGFSTCFRREAGSAGKDTKGIFRVHQFDKVEQYVFCHPDDSWKLHEEMLDIAKEIYKDLEIPFRVVNVASREMNDNAAKKYDLETWFPAQKKYRELVSVSNCTDFQARKLGIRMGKAGSLVKNTPHTLNGTAIATQRTICALLENHQQEDGTVKIPKALQQYMRGKKQINGTL
ncbi:MAG: serine--tRNA ligase [Candidatus Ranarchaeia archaeon]|jgi:seryl-tRNA synthetase